MISSTTSTYSLRSLGCTVLRIGGRVLGVLRGHGGPGRLRGGQLGRLGVVDGLLLALPLALLQIFADDIRVGLAEAGLFLLLVLLGEEVVEVGHGGGEDGGLLGRAREVK